MLRLEAGALACDIVPALGGAIAGLWLGDTPVLRSTPGAQLGSVRQSGSYPLVPFSNRIAQATLQWQGTDHPLVRNFAPEPHAIHGVGWQRPWEVLESSDQFALLAFEHRADPSWPFDFDCSQTFQLTPQRLALTLSMTNQSAHAAPAGLGWHPYFVKRASSRIRFESAGRWEMGPDKLPTERLACPGLDAPCAALDVDHCFDGWKGLVSLTDDRLRLSISANLSRLVVFTNPSRDFVAIEPVSHVNNALNLAGAAGPEAVALGVRVLAPGESMTVQMVIEVTAV